MGNKGGRVVLIGIIAICGIGMVYYAGDKIRYYFFSGQGQYEGKPTNYWIKALGDPDVDKRQKAASYLGLIGSDAKEAVLILLPLLERLDDPSALNVHRNRVAGHRVEPGRAGEQGGQSDHLSLGHLKRNMSYGFKDLEFLLVTRNLREHFAIQDAN